MCFFIITIYQLRSINWNYWASRRLPDATLSDPRVAPSGGLTIPLWIVGAVRACPTGRCKLYYAYAFWNGERIYDVDVVVWVVLIRLWCSYLGSYRHLKLMFTWYNMDWYILKGKLMSNLLFWRFQVLIVNLFVYGLFKKYSFIIYLSWLLNCVYELTSITVYNKDFIFIYLTGKLMFVNFHVNIVDILCL